MLTTNLTIGSQWLLAFGPPPFHHCLHAWNHYLRERFYLPTTSAYSHHLGSGSHPQGIAAAPYTVMKSKLGSTELTKNVEICRYPRYRGTLPLASDNPTRQSYAIREKLHTRRSRRNEGHTKECYVSEAIQLDKDCSPPVSPFRPVCPAEK